MTSWALALARPELYCTIGERAFAGPGLRDTADAGTHPLGGDGWLDLYIDVMQGGRSWQPFNEHKNGHKISDKFVVFPRN